MDVALRRSRPSRRPLPAGLSLALSLVSRPALAARPRSAAFLHVAVSADAASGPVQMLCTGFPKGGTVYFARAAPHARSALMLAPCRAVTVQGVRWLCPPENLPSRTYGASSNRR